MKYTHGGIIPAHISSTIPYMEIPCCNMHPEIRRKLKEQVEIAPIENFIITDKELEKVISELKIDAKALGIK